MKKSVFFSRILSGLFLSGALTLAGCSQDEPADVPAGSNAISFWMQGAPGGLRSTSTPTDYISGFVVNAHHSKETNYGPSDYLLRGVTVYRGEGGGNTWQYSPVSYFPVGDAFTDYVDFFAYSPAGSNRVSPKLGDAADANQTIGYTVPKPSGINGGAATQEDLLVAYQKVGADDYDKTVKLQFRHALSRVLVAAKSSLASSNVTVTGLTLKNLYSEGTLNLKGNTSTGTTPSNGIPQSTVPPASTTEQDSWVYNDQLVTIGNYVTLWQSLATPEEYTYVLPALGVTVGATSELVTTVEQGMFVLPQTTAGDLSQALNSATDFYLEVAYSLDGKAQTPASIRFADINGVANQSVTFEIGRQYVLNLTFGGTGGGVQVGAVITFSDIDADTYLPPVKAINQWAASNIYFAPDLVADPLGTIGALTFSESDKSKSGYQGLFFKWGSLIGVAAGDDGNFEASTYLYIPDVATGKYYKVKVSDVAGSTEQAVEDFRNSAAVGAWDGSGGLDTWKVIPNVDTLIIWNTILPDPRIDNRLTAWSGTAQIPYDTYKGDVCKFISSRPASGLRGSWIMPTSAMLPGTGAIPSFPYTGAYTVPHTVEDGHVWDLVPNWTGTGTFSSDDPDGIGSSDDTGAILKDVDGDLVFRLPGSGYRNSSGVLGGRGMGSVYFMSSLQGAYTTAIGTPLTLSAYSLSAVGQNDEVNVVDHMSPNNAFSVRCVRE
jgi:hypothetical protein